MQESQLLATVGSVTMPGGKQASRVGIGCWPIGGPDDNLGMPMGWSTATDAAAREGLERAFELGANLFDTADVYGHGNSERLIGGLLSHLSREDVVICGKTGYFTGTAPHAYDPRHMRRQLEQTLENLGTNYLDLYAMHNNAFGPDDRYLEGAVEAFHDFKREGLIRGIGMRGPHRYAPDRLSSGLREDKYARFRKVFEQVRPDMLAVRFNLLTPSDRGIFEFAAERGIPVLISKPLAQGLLTGKHTASNPPRYGPGDHRTRKRWFTPAALATLDQELMPLRERFGRDRPDLVRIALRWCLSRGDHTVVLVGFTTPAQVDMNLTCLGPALTTEDLAFTREISLRVQAALDEGGEVFIDEAPVPVNASDGGGGPGGDG